MKDRKRQGKLKAIERSFISNKITNQDNNKILIYTSDDGQVKIEASLEYENSVSK